MICKYFCAPPPSGGGFSRKRSYFMKKRYLLSAILALVLGLGLTALVACDRNPDHPSAETGTAADNNDSSRGRTEIGT